MASQAQAVNSEHQTFRVVEVFSLPSELLKLTGVADGSIYLQDVWN